MSVFEILVKEIKKAIDEHPKKIIELQVLEDKSEGKLIYIPNFFSDLLFGEFFIPFITPAIKEEKDEFFIIDPMTLIDTLSQRKKGNISLGLLQDNGRNYSVDGFVDFILFERTITNEPLEEIETTLDFSSFLDFEYIPMENIGQKEVENSLKEFMERSNKTKSVEASSFEIKVSDLEEENDEELKDFPSFFDVKVLSFSGQVDFVSVKGFLDIFQNDDLLIYSSKTNISHDDVKFSTKLLCQNDKTFLSFSFSIWNAGRIKFTNITRFIF